MRTRALLVLAVAGLAVLAGCSGLGGGGQTTTAAPTDTTTTASNGDTTTTTASDGGGGTTTTTTTTTATTTTAPSGSRGALPADAGVRHVEALERAGSFTVTQDVLYENETATLIRVDSQTQLNLQTNRGYRNGSFSFGQFASVQSVFTTNTVTFQRTNSSFQPRPSYERYEPPYGGEVTPVNLTTTLGQTTNQTTLEVPYEDAGTTTIDGVQVTEYTASGQQVADAIGIGESDQFENATVVSATTSVFIGTDDVIRRISFEIVLQTDQAGRVTVSFEQRVTAVGSTEVPDPEWLDEAQQATDDSTSQ